MPPTSCFLLTNSYREGRSSTPFSVFPIQSSDPPLPFYADVRIIIIIFLRYGCGFSAPQNSTYMQELIVRWYQFGCFSPVFRTHGCRYGHDGGGLEPDDPCVHRTYSCGANEVWSYGDDTQKILEKYIRLRATMKPYIQELAANVTKSGVLTMRPLWYEFPEDDGAYGINDQYMLGPKYLVAPVTIQNQTSRKVYFPKGASWKHVFTGDVVVGGKSETVAAPIEEFPVYTRV